jgi:spermidine dehydrogenase
VDLRRTRPQLHQIALPGQDSLVQDSGRRGDDRHPATADGLGLRRQPQPRHALVHHGRYAPIYKPGLPLKQQGVVGRAELLGTSFTDYERQIREQMTKMFASGGFEPTRDIAGIILNRWGHAYLNPGPGFLFGANGAAAPPDVIRQPLDRIAIGHSELRGHQYWTGAAGEGRRAVETLLDSYF